LGGFSEIAKAEFRQIITIRPSDRPWQMPFAAALSSGAPLLIGAWFGHMDYGLISSLGGMVFLYLPETPLYHRMVSVMAGAFVMIACYAFGLMSALAPSFFSVATLAVASALVIMLCRIYNVGPPGGVFFIMAASIGVFTPPDLLAIPLRVGLLAMGSLLACLIAFFYSLFILRWRAPKSIAPLPVPTFDFIVFDSLVIGLSVGLSLIAAEMLELKNPYWAPVSCLAVIQGASFRAAWERQTHRLLGTILGLGLAWALLALHLDKWGLSAVMIVLAFIIEMAVMRHYGFAAIFITPLTILLAEAAQIGSGSANSLILVRLYDTLLGCGCGLFGAACLHNSRFRDVAGAPLRRFFAAWPGAKA
jgi:uncharacterized membrane protein YccC